MTCGPCDGRGKVAVLRGMEDCCACFGSGILCACGQPACEQDTLCGECSVSSREANHADDLHDAAKMEED